MLEPWYNGDDDIYAVFLRILNTFVVVFVFIVVIVTISGRFGAMINTLLNYAYR